MTGAYHAIRSTAEVTSTARSPRQLITVHTSMSTAGYTEHTTEQRTRATGIATATVVSSQTEAGTQAPAWDLDWPCALTVASNGELTLWVDAPLRRRPLARLISFGESAGLFIPYYDKYLLGRSDRQTRYAKAVHATLDTSARDAVLSHADAASLGATLEAVVTAADMQVAEDPKLVEGPPMANPWPLRLSHQSWLIPSSRAGHHHLYIDTEMAWATYARLLKLARRARLLESGYVKVSLRREGTHLRMPWLRKAN